jgi:hypothetical protein
MTDATVVLNGATVATHQGGYLPWTTKITRHLRKGANVLAVIVDGRWLNVPPNARPGGADTIDYLQPAGIYRDVTLQVVPGTLIAANPLPLATLGGVAGGFIRSEPGKTGTVTVTAAHATLGRSSVQVTISPVARTGPADDGPKTTE